jgi:hypothetical protein
MKRFVKVVTANRKPFTVYRKPQTVRSELVYWCICYWCIGDYIFVYLCIYLILNFPFNTTHSTLSLPHLFPISSSSLPSLFIFHFFNSPFSTFHFQFPSSFNLLPSAFLISIFKFFTATLRF